MTEAADERRLADPVELRRQRLIGIALMCVAVLCFSCLDTTAKFLNTRMATLEVVWARYASAFLLALIVSNPVSRPELMVTSRPGLQIVRSALLLVSTMLGFLALRFRKQYLGITGSRLVGGDGGAEFQRHDREVLKNRQEQRVREHLQLAVGDRFPVAVIVRRTLEIAGHFA